MGVENKVGYSEINYKFQLQIDTWLQLEDPTDVKGVHDYSYDLCVQHVNVLNNQTDRRKK